MVIGSVEILFCSKKNRNGILKWHRNLKWATWDVLWSWTLLSLGTSNHVGSEVGRAGSSLVVQWLGLCSVTARAWVQFLVGELRSYKQCSTTKRKKIGLLELGAFLLSLEIRCALMCRFWFWKVYTVKQHHKIMNISSSLVTIGKLTLNG